MRWSVAENEFFGLIATSSQATSSNAARRATNVAAVQPALACASWRAITKDRATTGVAEQTCVRHGKPTKRCAGRFAVSEKLDDGSSDAEAAAARCAAAVKQTCRRRERESAFAQARHCSNNAARSLVGVEKAKVACASSLPASLPHGQPRARFRVTRCSPHADVAMIVVNVNGAQRPHQSWRSPHADVAMIVVSRPRRKPEERALSMLAVGCRRRSAGTLRVFDSLDQTARAR